MAVPLFLVDAFTDRPFAGNPAAICLLPQWREDRSEGKAEARGQHTADEEHQ